MHQYIRAYAFVSCPLCPSDLARISSHQPVTPSHGCPVILVCSAATETNLIVLTTQTDTWPGKPVCATPVENSSKERCHKSLSLSCRASYHEKRENRSYTPVHSVRDDGHCPAGYRANRRILRLWDNGSQQNCKKAPIGIGAFGYVGSLYWRLAPSLLTGRGRKLRCLSHSRTRCSENRRLTRSACAG